MENELDKSTRNPKVLIVALLFVGCIAACQKSNNSNSSPNANASPLPPGLSTSPLPTGATPTPGIPDVNAPKTLPSGTPTPGIPDINSLKKGKTAPLNEKTTPSKGVISAGENNRRRP